ncbi:MAG: hypothetical protein HXY37_09585 [Chloroflexi bacterium]|nr:hypothetical protein [Chloroflexota bacterium]
MRKQLRHAIPPALVIRRHPITLIQPLAGPAATLGVALALAAAMPDAAPLLLAGAAAATSVALLRVARWSRFALTVTPGRILVHHPELGTAQSLFLEHGVARLGLRQRVSERPWDIGTLEIETLEGRQRFAGLWPYHRLEQALTTWRAP